MSTRPALTLRQPPDLEALHLSASMRALVESAAKTRYQRGQRVVAEGDAVDGLYVVLGGSLRASPEPAAGGRRARIGHGAGIGHYAAGDCISEIGLDGMPAPADIVALQECWVAHVPRPELLREVRAHPALANELLAEAISHARAVTARLRRNALTDDERWLS